MFRTTAILATLAAYNLVLIGIGVWASGRTRSEEDYYLGGRRLGPWVAALSASASSSSAWTLLGVSGFAWSFGLSAVWLFPGCVGGFLLNWYVLAPRLRAAAADRNAVTVTEFLAGPPGTPYRKPIVFLASGVVLVFLTLYVASQFQGAGKTFSQTFGIGSTEAVLVGSGVVVLYTLVGGFWAVSVTDTVQGLVMALTSVALPVAALTAVGGPAGLARSLSTVPVGGVSSVGVASIGTGQMRSLNDGFASHLWSRATPYGILGAHTRGGSSPAPRIDQPLASIFWSPARL